MRIQLSDHFTYNTLLRFTLPSIVMMVFTSIYGIVDGLFVSNFVGKTSFAAINFILPVLNILGTFGYMIGAGGSALVSKTLGTGNKEKANRLFSMFVYLSIALGLMMGVAGIIFIRPLAAALGADGEMLDACVLYARIVQLSMPAWILQYEFQIFFVTAERPQYGLYITVLAGVINIVLDALFIAVFKFGIIGAAAATAISQFAAGCLPFIYFARNNSSLLHLGRSKFETKSILLAVSNGSSEFISGIAGSAVSILYNAQLIRYAGENGVASYGILMYVSMLFSAIFFGYASGTAPIIGFHYGAQNHTELNSLLRKSYVILTITAIAMFVLAELLAQPLAMIFARYDKELMEMTIRGFRLFSFSFLVSGIAVFGSSFFTALNDGPISAAISFMRTLIFQTGSVLLLPHILKVDGIWLSDVLAETLAAAVTIAILLSLRSKYHY